jgi:hypothetical protein
MKILKKAGALGAIAAFVRSPAGQQLIEKAKQVAADPRTKATAREIARTLRSRKSKVRVVEADPPR